MGNRGRPGPTSVPGFRIQREEQVESNVAFREELHTSMDVIPGDGAGMPAWRAQRREGVGTGTLSGLSGGENREEHGPRQPPPRPRGSTNRGASSHQPRLACPGTSVVLSSWSVGNPASDLWIGVGQPECVCPELAAHYSPRRGSASFRSVGPRGRAAWRSWCPGGRALLPPDCLQSPDQTGGAEERGGASPVLC